MQVLKNKESEKMDGASTSEKEANADVTRTCILYVGQHVPPNVVAERQKMTVCISNMLTQGCILKWQPNSSSNHTYKYRIRLTIVNVDAASLYFTTCNNLLIYAQ